MTPLLGPRPALAALVALGFLLALLAPLALAGDDDEARDERSSRDERRSERLEQHDHDEDEDDRDDRKGHRGKGLLGPLMGSRRAAPPPTVEPAPVTAPRFPGLPPASSPGPGEMPPPEGPVPLLPASEAPTQATEAPLGRDEPASFGALGVLGSAVRHLMVIGGVALMVALALAVLGRRGG